MKEKRFFLADVESSRQESGAAFYLKTTLGTEFVTRQAMTTFDRDLAT